ncbi:RNA-directed DNA polymerase [Eubacteriales bacterium OttesenSCG-928-A19]|nr:RNA-directed DNA polymerase [Eubacteriales bacterium OttesenSCG-928-A19]
MTSGERREARYQRRKAKRETRRLGRLALYNFDRVTSPDALWKAATESRRGVYWKASVQRYNMNLLRNSIKASKSLRAGADLRKGFISFTIIERGKLRRIQSVHFSERVVQRSLCSNALIPLLTGNLIHDNGASLAKKGIDFAVNRLKTHLRRHYKEHGTEGYVLLVDFKGYFNTIQHEPLYDVYRRAFGEDSRLVDLASLFVSAFGDCGLGLGSETSQINAITYPNSIDHYIKEVLGCKYYGRYMDDSYFICESKEHARRVLEAISLKYAEKGLVTSPKKTATVKLSRGITFLKTHFLLTDTGHIVARPCRESVTRQRRKLKKFRKFYDEGVMTLEQIRNSYMSWRGFIAHKNARRTIHNMDALYIKLFGISPLQKGGFPQCTNI